MRRINLLAASALALALAAPAYSQTAAPGDSTTKPTEMQHSAPADNPDSDKSAPGATAPDKKDKSASADKATSPSGGIITQQAESQKLADDLIGMKVENPNKENVGKISNLILDDQNRVVGAVLSVGGFLGIGDKHVGLAWNDIKLQGSGKDQVAVVTLSKDQLKSAPAFKSQADLKSDQEAERRKLQQPSAPSGGAIGGSSGTSRGTTR